MPSRPPVHRPARSTTVPSRTHVNENRGSAASRGYDRDWRRLREVVLAAEPLCRFCAERGRVVPARDVDHIRTIEEAPHLRLDRVNLRPLCTPCHSARTGRDQGGRGGRKAGG